MGKNKIIGIISFLIIVIVIILFSKFFVNTNNIQHMKEISSLDANNIKNIKELLNFDIKHILKGKENILFIDKLQNAYTYMNNDIVKMETEEFNVTLKSSYGIEEYSFYKAVVQDDIFIFPEDWHNIRLKFIPVSEENKWYVATDLCISEINADDLSITQLTSDKFNGKEFSEIEAETVQRDFKGYLLWIDEVLISPDNKFIIYSTNRDGKIASEKSIWKINLETKSEEEIIEPFIGESGIRGFLTNDVILQGRSCLINVSNYKKINIDAKDDVVVDVKNGKIFYSDKDLDSLIIYDVDETNGELVEIMRKEIDIFPDFKFSNDGNKMITNIKTNNQKEDVIIYDLKNNDIHFLSEFIQIDSGDIIESMSTLWLNEDVVIIKIINDNNFDYNYIDETNKRYIIFDTRSFEVVEE